MNDKPKSKIWLICKYFLLPLIIAMAGGFATHEYSLIRAPDRTKADTENILGLANSISALTASGANSQELKEKLSELKAQARAIEANLVRLRTPEGTISTHVDFWLPLNRGATLGGTTPFAVIGVPNSGRVYVRLKGHRESMDVADPKEFTNKNGETCSIIYVTRSPDHLYGFKLNCPD